MTIERSPSNDAIESHGKEQWARMSKCTDAHTEHSGAPIFIDDHGTAETPPSTTIECNVANRQERVCATNMASQLEDAAAKTLSGHFDLTINEVRNPAILTRAFRQNERFQRFRPTRRREHLQHLVRAYCLLCLMENSDFGASLQRDLASAYGLKGKKALNQFRVAAESCFDYGSNDQDEKKQGRVTRSRDVGALNHLRCLNVFPYQIPLIARRPGEGIDNWHREYVKAKRLKAQSAAVPVRDRSDSEDDQLSLPFDDTVATSTAVGFAVESGDTAPPVPEERSAVSLALSDRGELFSMSLSLEPSYVLRLVREDTDVPPNIRVLHVVRLPGNLGPKALDRLQRGMTSLREQAMGLQRVSEDSQQGGVQPQQSSGQNSTDAMSRQIAASLP